MTKHKKNGKIGSDPKTLGVRMEHAHAQGVPMDLDYDECTSVIDVALGKVRESRDVAVCKAQELVRKLGESGKVPA